MDTLDATDGSEADSGDLDLDSELSIVGMYLRGVLSDIQQQYQVRRGKHFESLKKGTPPSDIGYLT